MSQSTLAPNLRSIFVVCADLQQSRAFYENLGFGLLKEKSRSIILSAGLGMELHLHGQLRPEEEKTFGVSHGLGSSGMVQSYTAQDLDHLASKTEQQQIIFGPAHTDWGDRILLVKDPDGHRLEFREGRN